MASHRIALVSSFPPSGAVLNEYGYHMARELALRPDVQEVVVVADQLQAGLEEQYHGKKIRVVRCWKYNGRFAAAQIARVLSREKIDGAIFNLQMDSFGRENLAATIGLCGPMLARMSGIKVGVVAHNLVEVGDIEGGALQDTASRQILAQMGNWLASFSMTRANYLVTPLNSYAENLRRRFPAADVTMIPHGTLGRSEIKLPCYTTRPRRIVTMGKFGTHKRLETLISAFEKLQSYKSGVSLVIGGTDHPKTPGYMASVKSRCSGNTGILFRGYIAEEAVPDFFANSRLSIFDCTGTVGSSGIMHQCASFGSVPVFPYIGKFIELCEREGLKGYTYEPGDAGSLAAVLSKALDNVNLSSKYADTNREAVSAFPLSKIVDFHLQKLVGDCEDENRSKMVFASK